MNHEELKQKIAEYKGISKAEEWEREYRTKKAQEAVEWAVKSGDPRKIQKAEKELQAAKNWKGSYEMKIEIEAEALEKMHLSKAAAMKKFDCLNSEIITLERRCDDHGYDSKVPRDWTDDEIRLSNAINEKQRLKMYIAVCC